MAGALALSPPLLQGSECLSKCLPWRVPSSRLPPGPGPMAQQKHGVWPVYGACPALCGVGAPPTPCGHQRLIRRAAGGHQALAQDASQPGLLTLRATGGWGGGHSLTLLVHVDGDPAQGGHRVHQEQALVPGGRGSREQEGLQTLPLGGVSGGAYEPSEGPPGKQAEPPASHRMPPPGLSAPRDQLYV